MCVHACVCTYSYVSGWMHVESEVIKWQSNGWIKVISCCHLVIIKQVTQITFGCPDLWFVYNLDW